MSVWRWLTTSCEVGWQRHARFLALGWLGGLGVCVAALWVGDGLYYFLDFRWSGRPLSGLMTLAGGFCLMACGWGLFVAARRAMRAPGGRREAAGWLVGGLGSIWLAFDEVAQFHEHAAEAMARLGVPRPLGVLDHDLYIFGAYAAGLLLVLVTLWPTRRPLEPAMLPLSVAIACFGISEAADQVPWESMTPRLQLLVGAVEEVSKTIGSWSLAMCGLLCADEATREDVRAGASAPAPAPALPPEPAVAGPARVAPADLTEPVA